jgi:hypothetical protein
MKGSMSLTVADLAQHIVTLRRLYARVLEADIDATHAGQPARMSKAAMPQQR